MEELRSLVVRARDGDTDAYGEIVRRFQDMAFGYAYSILGDFHLAEDAAQEAFVGAYRDLGKLDRPAAFPGWFRRIVFKYCDRLTRHRRAPMVPLASASTVQSKGPGPSEAAAKRELADRVLEAIRSLPEHERIVTTLFYINGYSQQEVADFLEVPTTTVNNRLHASRERLKERMMAMVADELNAAKPGPEQRQAILDVLAARRDRFQKDVTESLSDDKRWAGWWHERRMKDVYANAAQYGIEPDEGLPRMKPERHASESFRDDFLDLPRRWGIPDDVPLQFLRELCRSAGVGPVTLCRWEAQGLPIVRYLPWFAYDANRAGQWLERRSIRPDERMSRSEAREPLLLTLRALAGGEVTEMECRQVLQGLETALIAATWGDGQLDPLWADDWRAKRPEERTSNARQYGMAEPLDTGFGLPGDVEKGRIHEIRDLARRLGVSPFDVMRWTRAGMPCLRCSPEVRWDIERVAAWLAQRGELPQTQYRPKELDDLDGFILEAVSDGRESPEDARDIFTIWMGLM